MLAWMWTRNAADLKDDAGNDSSIALRDVATLYDHVKQLAAHAGLHEYVYIISCLPHLHRQEISGLMLAVPGWSVPEDTR